MGLNTLIYIASNLLLLQLVSLQSGVVNLVIYILCGLGVLTLGIAHGAIDNILYGAKQGLPKLYFMLKYLAIIAIFAIVWFFLPNLAFILFLLISAYHFGQSQFVEYDFQPGSLAKALFLLWGSLVFLFMFHFSGQELIVTLGKEHIFFVTAMEHLIAYSWYYLIAVSGLFFSLFLGLIFLNKLSLELFFKEAYLLLLIACSFYLLSPFIAFAVFFILIHSLRVMFQEYEYCKETLEIQSIVQFIRLFLPLTIYSLLGTAIILFLVSHFGAVELIPYTLIILLSCVTLPHSLVMDKFYNFIPAKNK